MSTISAATDVGTLAYTLYNMRQTANSIGTLTQQASSGYIASDYAGLGAGAGAALDLTGQLAVNQTLQANAASASNVQQVTQSALGQIQTLVSGMANSLLGPGTSTASGLSTLATGANDALNQIAGLLDTRVGGVYIFAGQDSTNPPVPDPSSVTTSAFYSAIQAAVAALPANGATAVQAQVLGIASPGGTSPFSATLEASSVPATVDLGGGQREQVGMLANQNTDAIPAGVGTTSTGSYMRDILMGLATLGSLNGTDPAQPSVQAMVSGVQATLSAADLALNTDIGGLGVRQNAITSGQSELASVATALTTQLGNVQDVDQATVATQLAAAQTRLQASYSLVAALDQLTLAKDLA